jgi:hypothetical protein
MFQMLTRRGSAPPLSEQASFDIHPAFIQFFRASEPFDLDKRVGPVDDQLIALAVDDGTHFATDETFGATEEADHACNIGNAIETCRAWPYTLSSLNCPKLLIALNGERQIDGEPGTLGRFHDGDARLACRRGQPHRGNRHVQHRRRSKCRRLHGVGVRR